MGNKKKRLYGMNIGSSSMLLIFVILCLMSFAALSIVSASADRRLSEKIADRTQAYYAACNSAELSLSHIDDALIKQYESAPDSESYFAAVGHNKSYIIPIDDNQLLSVEIEILYPESENDTFYRITCWQVIAAME